MNFLSIIRNFPGGNTMFFGHNKENKKDFIYSESPVNNNIELTVNNIKHMMLGSEDIIFREILVNNVKVTILYIDGLINNTITSDFILKPLKQDENIKTAKSESQIIKLIQEGNIYYASQKTRTTANDVISDILLGSTALIFDNEKTAITFHNAGFEKRSITEPTGENVIRGSKDSFVETLRVNTSIIRNKIKSQNLKIEQITIGERTQTPVDIIYIDGIVNIKMVDELKKRLEGINIDGALTTSIIEEYLIERKYTLFPQIIYTERSDKFCSDIVEGRIGLIVDGIPSTFILPATLLQCLQAPEDYSQNFIFSSAIRLMRFVLMVIALILPAFYTAVTSFHQEMIPSKLASFIVTAKEGVPFPTFIEVIFMLVTFEILIEAGIRLPKAIGQAMSIVGAVIVGQSAIEANLVSPAVLVIVALSAISSFAMPNQDLSNAIRFWRFIIVILASIIGLFGLMMGLLALLLVLADMEFLGVPYLSPFVASEYMDLKDSIFRLRLPNLHKRPYNLKTSDRKRR